MSDPADVRRHPGQKFCKVIALRALVNACRALTADWPWNGEKVNYRVSAAVSDGGPA
jgi:hypothetical protein